MSRDSVVYLLFTLCLAVWFGLIISAPLLHSMGHDTLAELNYYPFSYACHQLPDRSFLISNYKLGVCSRCTGIYLGMLISGLSFPLLRGIGNRKLPSKWILAIAMTPLVLDGATQFVGLRVSTNILRFSTGLLFGFALTLYILPVLFELVAKRR